MSLARVGFIGFFFALGCGDSFKPKHEAFRGPSSELPVSQASVQISQPPAQTSSKGEIRLEGTCTSGASVGISGDLLSAQNVACEGGRFLANVQMSAPDGAKNIVVKQTNARGEDHLDTRSFVRDTVAPALSLIAPVQNAFVRGQVVLQGLCESGSPIALTEQNLRYVVACNNGAFATTLTLQSTDGPVRLELEQTDAAGNSGKTSLSLSKDTLVPLVSISSPMNGTTVGSSVSVAGSCEIGSTVQIAGSGIQGAVSVVCATAAYDGTVVLTAGAGSKQIVVTQTDAAGNMGTASRTVNRAADVGPTVTITQPATGAVFRDTVALMGTCQTGLAIALSGADLTSPATATCTNGAFSVSLTFSNGDGTKNVIVSQTNAQNLTGSASRSFIRDTTAPTITIASPSANSAWKSGLTLVGACENGLTVQISGTGTSAASNVACANGAYSANVTLSAGDGSKLITVRQIDAAGNTGSASRTFLRDTTGPALTIASPAAGTSGILGLTILGACEAAFPVNVSGSGVLSPVSKACSAGSYAIDFVFSAGEGAKMVTVSQADAAGNVTSSTREFSRAAAAVDFTTAKAVLNQYCNSCHGAGGQAANIDFKLGSEQEFVSKGYIVVGDPDKSKLIFRMIHYNGATAGGSRNMPLGFTATSFPVAAYNTLYNWVLQMKASTPAPASTFACTDPNARSTSLSYMLTKSQYTNSLAELFGAGILTTVSTQLSVLPKESFDANSHSRSADISVARVEGYHQIANAIAASTVMTVFGSCASGSPTAACIDTYLNGMAKRIFRRPLTSEEKTYARGIANGAGVYKDNLTSILSYHLQSPQFVWRFEEGKATQSSTSIITLTPYEVASRLAFMANDTTPDAQLLALADTAAASGRDLTLTELKTHAARLLQTTNGRKKLIANLKRYSMSEQVQNVSLLPAALKAGVETNGLTQAVLDEMDMYIEEMVFTKRATFKKLLTAKESWASHGGLATIYGHAPTATRSAPALIPESERRQGLLMRAAFLSGPFSRTAIIRRGVNFQKRVLCNEISTPSQALVDIRDADQFSEEEALLHTNREAVAYNTKSPVCMTCHATINATGFAFEGLDPLGRIRSTESIFDPNGMVLRSLSIDSRTDVPLAGGGHLSVQDAFDLVSYVAESAEGSGCFSRNAFRFVNEKRETAEDYCALNEVQKTLSDSNKSVLDAMVELIANNTIFVKKN